MGGSESGDSMLFYYLRSYIDQSSKKKVQLSDRVYTKMKSEKERPRTPTLKECQSHILPMLEEAFVRFWNVGVTFYPKLQLVKLQIRLE